MRFRRIVAAVAAAPLALVAFACGDSSTSTFNEADSASDGQFTDTSYFQDDSGDGARDAPTTCAPALPAGFAPAWKAPVTSATACKSGQLTAYAAACLGQPYNAGKCDAFKQANAACAACAESDDTAAQYGPVVWHDKRTYFTLNTAGCIAITSKDASSTGCAAAYQAVLVCQEVACDSCFSIQNPTFSTFQACEKSAGKTVCQSYAAGEGSKCATVHAPDAATNACFPASGTVTAADLFAQIAPLFCGGS